MSPTHAFHLSGGITKTDEIIRITRKLRGFGKPVSIVAYDTIQGLQWNGGRLVFNTNFVPDSSFPRYSDITIENPGDALDRVARLNDEGIAFNLTFNSTMESLDTEDAVGNFLLERLHNGMNSVTVATESLRRHIRSHYPNYSIVASICLAMSTLEECVQACQRYDRVVMLPVFAYEPERFACLPKDKLIFLINDLCYLFCVRKDHYDYISRCHLAGNTTREEQTANFSNLKCFAQSVPGYRNKVRFESDREVNARVSALWLEHLAREGHKPGDLYDFNFNITQTARRGIIRAGITQFKLQGREMEDATYQHLVVDFLEMVVRDEL
jgi:hypothetical protein